jgi:trans-aconitate methyltransferase
VSSDQPEQDRLETIAARSVYAEGTNATSIRYGARVFSRYWEGESCLELGPAEGLATELLAGRYADLTLVDGSETFCAELRGRFPQATVIHSLFEDWEPQRRFDHIVIGCVLEHVDDPVSLMSRAAGWLEPGGRIQCCVPNAQSLHRQAGVLLGQLPAIDAFTEKDLAHGHRRVYTPDRLAAAIAAAGLEIEARGGWWLKPLSDAQIEADWSPELLDAYMQIGERYPEIAAVIYAVARRAPGA